MNTITINPEIKSNQRGYRYHIISQHMRNKDEEVIFTSSNKIDVDRFFASHKGSFPYRYYIETEIRQFNNN